MLRLLAPLLKKTNFHRMKVLHFLLLFFDVYLESSHQRLFACFHLVNLSKPDRPIFNYIIIKPYNYFIDSLCNNEIKKPPLFYRHKLLFHHQKLVILVEFGIKNKLNF